MTTPTAMGTVSYRESFRACFFVELGVALYPPPPPQTVPNMLLTLASYSCLSFLWWWCLCFFGVSCWVLHWLDSYEELEAINPEIM